MQLLTVLQVGEKPLQNRALCMAVPRHLSQRRIKLLPRKYNTISDGKVMNDRTCKNRITSKIFFYDLLMELLEAIVKPLKTLLSFFFYSNIGSILC